MAKEKGIVTALAESLLLPAPEKFDPWGLPKDNAKVRARQIISYLKKHNLAIVRTVANDGPLR